MRRSGKGPAIAGEEKPISHDINEHKMMAAAVMKDHNQIVRSGTWQRSTREFTDARAILRAGKLETVVIARTGHRQARKPGTRVPALIIHRTETAGWVTTGYMPLRSQPVHSNWRWFLKFGRECPATGASNDDMTCRHEQRHRPVMPPRGH